MNTSNTKTSDQNLDSLPTQNQPISIKKGLTAKMAIQDTIKMGSLAQLRFTVYNDADTVQQFCKWHTPFEPLMSKYLEVKDENGLEVQYLGAMAKRMMPPPESSYIKVNAKDSISATVNLLKAYAIEKTSKYTISYSEGSISGLIVTDSISFVYLK
ncbi:MAG: protease [Daejeonella sp.]|nr:protease [Daejeonella sp.]